MNKGVLWLQKRLLRHRSWFTALFQSFLIFVSLVLAWLLRFDFSLPNRLLLFSAAPILILIRLAAIAPFGLLHGWWRYAGVNDAINIIKAILVGSLAFIFFTRLVLGIAAFPRSIYVLEAILSAFLLAGVRVCSRIVAESFRQDEAQRTGVILIGAGFAAQMLLREIERPGSSYRAIGCVDDDVSKVGMYLQGVPVIGTVEQLPVLAKTHGIHHVLIAVPSATGAQTERFVALCEKSGVSFKTVPAVRDIISGQANISQFRDVRLEDLLGRGPVEIDLESVRAQIEGRIVLVTGAAGSIGSELCRQILEYCPQTLICVDQSETGTFYLELELGTRKNSSHVVFCIADISDAERMQDILTRYKPEIVFHAAAYKHVPLMERNIYEAVKNNVFALLSLLETAEDNGCLSFVLISSDKAVKPTNVMGATKRIGELIIACRPAKSMRCVSVRFGNVLGSNGSVVPVFKKQIQEGRGLTITHPEIKRFFMTTGEAVSLVLQAFAIGSHGDILLLDMGEPIRILDLARTLIRLSQKSEKDVKIRFTGLRDGEKLFEELVYDTEVVHPTSFAKIKRIFGTPNRWVELHQLLGHLRDSIALRDTALMRAKMKAIVPEYSYEQAQPSEQMPAIPNFESPATAVLHKAAGVG